MHTEAPALVVAAGVSISAVLVVRSLRRYARRQDLLRHWAKVSLVPHDTTQFLIRLATQPDAVLASVSSLSQLKHLIEALGQPPLLPREMHTLPVSSLAARAGGWVRVAATTIIVMQFNLLAEGLSSGPDAAPPFVAVRRSEYGGFDSVARPELALAWDTRKLRLLEEILRYAPDVLTVQECDHFDDLLLPALRLAGYDGVFAAKRSAPGLEYGFYSDGTAVFWRTAVFERLGAERRVFTEADGSDSSRPYLLVLLRHVARGTTLLVCSTHLKAKLSQERQLHPRMIHCTTIHTHRTPHAQHMHACACACAMCVRVRMRNTRMRMYVHAATCSTRLTAYLAQEIEESRAVQITQLLAALEGRAATLADGVLLCGDFNTDPYDLPPPNGMRARCVPAVLRHPLGLRSAYPLPEDARSQWWTTWKKRGEHEVRHAADHTLP